MNQKNDGTKQISLEKKNLRIKLAIKDHLQTILNYPYLWAKRLLHFFILVPTVIFLFYYCGDQGFIFIETSLTVGDALSFYGTLLSFIGTIALGILALYQNIQANKINHRLLLLEEKESISFLIPDGELVIEFQEKPYTTDMFEHTFMADIFFPLKNYFGNIIQTFQILPPTLILKSNDNFYRWKKVGLMLGIHPQRIYLPKSESSSIYFHLAVPHKPELDPRNLDSFELVLHYTFRSISIYNDIFDGSCIIRANVHKDDNNELRYTGNIIIDELSYQSVKPPSA